MSNVRIDVEGITPEKVQVYAWDMVNYKCAVSMTVSVPTSPSPEWIAAYARRKTEEFLKDLGYG